MTSAYLEKHCPQFAALDEQEKDSVLTVISHAQAYGFGNMMAWLLTAWNLRLKHDMRHLKKGELPMSTRETTPYQIVP